MRRLLLFLVVLPAASGSPLIVAVVPDLPGPGPNDEAVAVAAPDGADLSGYALGDGEGSWRFPPGSFLAPGEVGWVVGNITLWQRSGGPPARWNWHDATDPPRLANSGDDLVLRGADGTPLDAFAWGTGGAAGMEGAVGPRSPGLVYTRLRTHDGWQDTDKAADWATPRMHRVGESDLLQPTFQPASVTAYASPDSSFQVLTELIAGARERLWIHIYELRSQALVDAIVAAKQATPGLDVQVLVDAAPVGLSTPHRHEVADALRRIEAAGGQAWLAGAHDHAGAPGRYAFYHMKVVLADDAVAVQSENGVPAGVPEDPSWGNRGWGIVVHDEAIADRSARWMAADRAAWDTAPFDLAAFDPAFAPPPRYLPRSGDHGPFRPPARLAGPFQVTPIIAPDHTADPASMPVWKRIQDAKDRVWVQQMTLRDHGRNPLGWEAPDPLFEALVAAASRGVDVRVQAAAPFSPDDAGNDRVLAALAAAGVQVGTLDRPGVAALHNKGIIVDDGVLVGSLNGNHASRSQNREAALWVEGDAVADHFASLFVEDWRGSVGSGRDWGRVGDDVAVWWDAVASPGGGAGGPGALASPLPILLVAMVVAAIRMRRN